MKNVVLIRHGQSLGQTARQQGLRRQDSSFTDCFLTRKGVQEAIQLRSNLVLNQYKFGLVCTSPLSRAVATCVLALGDIIENEIQENGVASTKFIANSDISEAGKGIPENRGRAIQVLLQDLRVKLSIVSPSVVSLRHIDFSMLPEEWPEIEHGKSEQKKKLERFVEWLANRPEENIAVVCHYNVIKWMLNNSIDRVPNCVPIECVLTDDARLVLKSERSESNMGREGNASKKKSRNGAQRKNRKNKK